MPRRTSIGIIGTGWVGSSVAISTLQAGAANELILYDVRQEIAEGEAMDLAHGSSFYPSAAVCNGTIQEMYNADAVVIAAGRGGSSGQSRLDLLNDNLNIVRDLAHQLRGYKGIVVVVTNPVDVLTYLFTKTSGLPPQRVIGTGTMLDTARLRQILGRKLSLDPRSIHAQVIGEHGDSEVVLWSGAYVGGMRLRSWPGWQKDQEASIVHEVRTAAHEIIRRKGATNHAIGLVTAALLRWMLHGERRVLTVSQLQSGALGLNDVALSLPTIVSAEGAIQVLEPELDEDERAQLERSASVLRKAAELAAL
ncbi:MAG TPA: L-lactate dehydrogenase [Blastocatellia bacterium]|nr:L-lactate dehydrogenase [Blastocatellia bacterium]